MLSAQLFYCQQRRTASQQRADDSLNANSWGLLIANSWGLPQCKERRTASMQTAEGCLNANSWGLSQCKQRRTASMQTTEDCLNANSWGLPQCIHLRAASQQITDNLSVQTAEDCLIANSEGLPRSRRHIFTIFRGAFLSFRACPSSNCNENVSEGGSVSVFRCAVRTSLLYPLQISTVCPWSRLAIRCVN